MDFSSYLKNAIAKQGLNKYAFGTLTQNATDRLNNLSMFSSASAQDIAGVDLKALLAAIEASDLDVEGATGDQKALNEILKAFLEIEDVQKAADADGDGKLTEAEAQKFLASIMGNDGDAKSLTMADIDKAIEKLGIDLNELANKAAEEVLEDKEQEVDNVSSAAGGGSVGGGGGVSGSSGSSGVSKTEKTKTTAEEVEELETQLADEESTKEEVQKLVEEKIQEQDKIIDDAMNEENSGFTPEAKKEYNEEKTKIDTDIKTKETGIEDQKTKIQDSEATISSTTEAIGSLKEQKDSLSSQLSAVGDGEDASDKKADIQSKISNLDAEITTKTSEKEKAEQAKEKAEKEKETLEKEKKQLEADRDGLMDKIIDKHKLDVDPKVQEKIKAAQAEIQQIRSDGQEAVSECDKNIQEIKTKIAQAKEKEKTKETIKANSVSNGSETSDFALGFDGKSAAEMKKLMQEKGYQFDDGAWCADFVSFALSQARGEDDLPDWYKNCGNRAYCPTIENAASSAGAIVDAANAQVGDAVTFTRNGRSGHIGIITKIDDDGTIHTIEGNTSDDNGNYSSGVVNEHTYSPSQIRAFISMKK